jgi:hypothetical protein
VRAVPMVRSPVVRELLRRVVSALDIQGVAGNKKGEFWVEDQFLSKLHTHNG